MDGNLKVNNEINAPVSGSADMKAYIYGGLRDDGSKVGSNSSSGFTSIRVSEGYYRVTFNNPISVVKYIVLATIYSGSKPSFISVRPNANHFNIRTYNNLGFLSDRYLFFVVYKK